LCDGYHAHAKYNPITNDIDIQFEILFISLAIASAVMIETGQFGLAGRKDKKCSLKKSLLRL